jgi:hypothetical protein
MKIPQTLEAGRRYPLLSSFTIHNSPIHYSALQRRAFLSAYCRLPTAKK